MSISLHFFRGLAEIYGTQTRRRGSNLERIMRDRVKQIYFRQLVICSNMGYEMLLCGNVIHDERLRAQVDDLCSWSSFSGSMIRQCNFWMGAMREITSSKFSAADKTGDCPTHAAMAYSSPWPIKPFAATLGASTSECPHVSNHD